MVILCLASILKRCDLFQIFRKLHPRIALNCGVWTWLWFRQIDYSSTMSIPWNPVCSLSKVMTSILLFIYICAYLNIFNTRNIYHYYTCATSCRSVSTCVHPSQNLKLLIFMPRLPKGTGAYSVTGVRPYVRWVKKDESAQLYGICLYIVVICVTQTSWRGTSSRTRIYPHATNWYEPNEWTNW